MVLNGVLRERSTRLPGLSSVYSKVNSLSTFDPGVLNDTRAISFVSEDLGTCGEKCLKCNTGMFVFLPDSEY